MTHRSHPVLYSHLQRYGRVIPVDVHKKDLSLDILVLPPGMGINPNLQCFRHGEVDLLPLELIDPAIEIFRERLLKEYIQYGVHIIGLGSNAALLWNEIGGKVGVASNNYFLLYPQEVDANVLSKDGLSVVGFQKDHLVGFTEMNADFSNALRNVVGRALKELGNSGTLASVVQPKVPKTPQPTGHYKQELPKSSEQEFEDLDEYL